jgi:hypothetical protein
MLVDYRLHPGILVAEDRTRASRDYSPGGASRGIRRIFRFSDSRSTGRETGRR